MWSGHADPRSRLGRGVVTSLPLVLSAVVQCSIIAIELKSVVCIQVKSEVLT